MKRPRILNKKINVLDLEMASFVSKITKENKELRKEYRKYKNLLLLPKLGEKVFMDSYTNIDKVIRFLVNRDYKANYIYDWFNKEEICGYIWNFKDKTFIVDLGNNYPNIRRIY